MSNTVKNRANSLVFFEGFSVHSAGKCYHFFVQILVFKFISLIINSAISSNL